MNVFGTGSASALCALAVAFTAIAGASRVTGQEFTFRLHHFSSPKSFDQTRHMGPWAERVNTQSGGRLKVQIYPSMQRVNTQSGGRLKVQIYPSMQLGGKPKDLIQQVRKGIVDMIYFVPGFAPGAFPVTAALELPFIGTGSIVMSQVAMEFYDRHLKDKPEYRGIRLIVMHSTDTAFLHTRNKPVRRLEDLSGMKIRVATRYIGLAVREFGGVPDGMPLPAVYEALARGRVDGMMIPWAITRPFRLYEVAKFHTEEPMYSTMLLTLMNQASYDRLPSDVRKVVDANSGMAYTRKLGVIWEEEAKLAREKALKLGNTIVHLTPEEFARWKAKAGPVHRKWTEEMVARGLDGEKMLNDLHAIVDKYIRKEGGAR